MTFVVLADFRLIDESPQWLIVAGKRGKAGKILKKIARYNGVEYSEKSLLREEDAAKETLPQEKAASISSSPSPQEKLHDWVQS